jgi:N-formylglutamate deformylase
MILTEATAPPYRYRHGGSVLIVSMPHAGTYVPHSVGAQLADAAAARCDTDWHLPRLYDFLGEMDATVLVAMHSRYAIDLNRPPDDANLYPGQDTTGLCPVDTFDKRALYRAGPPGPEERARRVERYWQPYHRRLAREIERVRSAHGRAVVWDAHSIVSVAPRFFPGRLADLNLGTAGGASCAPGLGEALLAAARRHPSCSAVLNGRFQGGYITRRYGEPARGVNAIQLEMAQATYMDEAPPYTFREDLAASVRPVLRELVATAAGWAQ